ncbi:glycosyl transferase [Sinisalibacter aestuarii]|uniref:Glycosyl transferase n=1 Tax=Sinisalibacter aestuarii TaxID=2949426 RepID=A0ABQ5LY90_9RHOB|nr:glycosyl transferase [Sinisalibacter aestuarii]GKY89380.1 glycosyl transferase [Sinisalibacter aestuarii]
MTETTLQALVLPEQEISTETALYFRPDGEVVHQSESGHLHLSQGARVSFDTYFNAFDSAEWQDACGLESLAFDLRGTGQVMLRVYQVRPNLPVMPTGGIPSVALETELVLSPEGPHIVDLSELATHQGLRLLYLEIEAKSAATITDGRFVTRDRPVRRPKLAVSITTFKREPEVQATARRLSEFLTTYEFADRIAVQIVDNGMSARIEETPGLRYITNANLGGSGGFARGMMEARASGATHCLFMDDDASFHMENIRRTFALLSFASDPTTAIAGAMITNTRKYEMFENGAIFDGICRPQNMHTDLREQKKLFKLLFRAAKPLPHNAYGGWWYFAFPLDHARHYPFPFFVRGDDSGFALANQFHIRTLNGVVSFQDSFGEKETPLINYLDARYHLMHHLVFEGLERGARRTALVPLRLIVKSLVRFHYEAAEAQLLAMRDVMAGPDFFLENADMSQRRQTLGALHVHEKWAPLDARPTRLRKPGHLTDRLWALTLNGHFIPFFGRFGARRVLRLSMRGPNWPIWGAREITYVNRATKMGYTVRLDRKRGLALLGQAIRQARALVRAYPDLVAEYRERYAEMTSEETWRKLLGLDEDRD